MASGKRGRGASKDGASTAKESSITVDLSRSNAAGGTSTRVIDKASSKLARRRRRNTPLIVGVVCAVVLAGVATAGALYLNGVQESMSYDDEELEELEEVLVDTDATSDIDPYYVLILGSDSRTSDTSGTRSDTIIIARIDPANATVHLISIPRDTMVYIDGYGIQKINAAYAWGGASLAVEVISEFAGVEFSEVVEVSFDALVDIVDALGGIEIDVQEAVSYGGVSVDEGLQTLTGEEALVYARDRKHVSGGDFGRASHQREVIEAIVESLLECSITEMASLITEFAGYVTTTYSVTDLVELGYAFYGSDITFYSVACPSYSYNSDGISYVATMYDEWREIMQRVDAGLDPEGDDEIPEEQQDNEVLGAATNAAGPTNYQSLAASAGLTTDDVLDSDDEDEDEE